VLSTHIMLALYAPRFLTAILEHCIQYYYKVTVVSAITERETIKIMIKVYIQNKQHATDVNSVPSIH